MNSEKVINAKKTRLLSEEQASFIITKTFRENIAQKSYSRMFSEGNYWKRKMDEPNGFASMKKLSADNISKLVKSLGSLDDNEIRFFEKILSLKFAITHATDANVINNNTLTLFSRKKLDERNISYRSGLSTARDIEEFKNDDFVFFP
ncbi:VPA1331 family putative T3SS effector [Vibrio parahaemolyticus]|nr:VPA1331 family putative T3SS effector [Vibrio parahaemolyticus]